MQDIDREIMRIEADAFARRHGLDARRARKAFRRMAESGVLGPKFPFFTDLDIAVRFVEPARALDIYEHEDLRVLSERVDQFMYLADFLTPLYTLAELADLLEAFVEHLRRNVEVLARMGHPQTSFAASRWLDWHLSRLYYVKLPVTVQSNRSPWEQAHAEVRGEAQLDEVGNIVYSYTWSEQAAHGEVHLQGPGQWRISLPFTWVEGKACAHDGSPVRLCQYEEAAIISELPPNDASRIGAMRPKLLELEIRILKHLANAVRNRGLTGLWQEAVRILTDALTAEDAEFLVQLDRFFDALQGEVRDVPCLPFFVIHNTGLSDFFHLIGHCEKELGIGAMDQTRRRLLALPVSPCSYYEAVGQPWRTDLDTALDLFFGLEAEQEDFLNDFAKLVNRSLLDDFPEEVTVRTKVKRGVAGKFERQVRTYAEWAKSYFEATGRLPALSILQEGSSGELRRRKAIEQLSDEGWTKPHGLKEWGTVFGQSVNTMRRWFKNGNVKNTKISPRQWKVAIDELPHGYDRNPDFVDPRGEGSK